jgi:hypothetical protein
MNPNCLKEVAMQYPLVEQDGRCASIAVKMAHGGRWKASVTLERSEDFARLKTHPEPISLPNSFPSDTAAAEAAYAHARRLIERELAHL